MSDVDPDRTPRRARLLDFLRSRGARRSCPLCGHDAWDGWEEVVALPRGDGSGEPLVGIPLVCRNCGFVRFHAARVLDDPRA